MSEQALTPRDDGICVDCLRKSAVTTDGCLCKTCLRKRIYHNNPIPKMASEQLGRPAISSRVLGGCCELNESEADDE